eukprot:342301-Amphidinium_carterae.1
MQRRWPMLPHVADAAKKCKLAASKLRDLKLLAGTDCEEVGDDTHGSFGPAEKQTCTQRKTRS